MDMDTIRRISIIARTEGVDKAAAELQKLAGAQDGVTSASEKTTKSSLSVERSYESLQRRVDQTHRATKDFERDLTTIARAQEQGLVPSTARLNELLALSSQRYAAATRGTQQYAAQTGLARHELINLSRQVQDVGVSLASGQSFGTVLIQQGSQIADIFASSTATVGSFWEQIAAGAGRILTPVRLAAGGVLAIGAAGVTAALQFSSAQSDVERSLVGMGRASGASLRDINRIANETSSAFGLSRSEAREFATTLAATGRIGVENIGEIVGIGKDVARVYGIDAADAAKKLAEAYANPARGAEELNQRLGAFDAATIRNIQSLQSQNRMMEAQALITAGVKSGVEGINNTVSTSTNFWTALGNAISNTWDKFGEGASRITGIGLRVGLDEQIAAAEQRLAGLQRRFSDMSPRVQQGPEGNRIFNMMKAEQAELVRLQGEWAKYGRSVEIAQARRDSFAERRLVFDALPALGQIEKANDGLLGLSRIMEQAAVNSDGFRDRLARAGITLENVSAATAAYREQIFQLNEGLERQSRLADINSGLRSRFSQETGSPIGTDVARQAAALDTMLPVLRAITEEQRLAAQEAANYAQRITDGFTPAEATLLSTRERRNAQAQINAESARTLQSARQQLQLAQAQTAAERMLVQQRQTYNNLLDRGANAQDASTVAQTEYQSSVEQANRSVEDQTRSLQQQTELIYARLRGDEACVAAAQAYANAMRQGADAATAAALAAATLANQQARAAEQEARAEQQRAEARERAYWQEMQQIEAEEQRRYERRNPQLSSGKMTLASPLTDQYISQQTAVFDKLFGSGNYTGITSNLLAAPIRLGGVNKDSASEYQRGLNDKYLQETIAKSLVGGANAGSLAQQLLSGSIGTRSLGPGEANLLRMQGVSSGISPNELLRTLLDLDKRGGVAPEETLAKLRSGIYGEGADAVELLRAIDELTQAVESNTDAQLDILSQLYTTDPRISRLGFRAGSSVLPYDPYAKPTPAPNVFGMAYGGIMSPDGPIPLRSFANGGITRSPSFFMTSEYGHEEAIIPLKGGKVPVELKGKPESTFNINIEINSPVDRDTVDDLGMTMFQTVQRLRQLNG